MPLGGLKNLYIRSSQDSQPLIWERIVYLLWTRVLGLLNQQKLIRGQTRNSGKALLGPLLQQGGEKTSSRFPCLLTLWFLFWGESRGLSRGQAEEVAQVVCSPLWQCCVQGSCTVPRFCSQHPAFAPGSSEVAVGFCFFFVFFMLLYIICPNCACTQLFLVPYSFLTFCCLRRHLSRCQHCNKGSQVAGPSLSHIQSTNTD